MRPMIQTAPIAAAIESQIYIANSHSEGRKIGSHSSVLSWMRKARSKSGCPDIAGTWMPVLPRSFATLRAVRK